MSALHGTHAKLYITISHQLKGKIVIDIFQDTFLKWETLQGQFTQKQVNMVVVSDHAVFSAKILRSNFDQHRPPHQQNGDELCFSGALQSTHEMHMKNSTATMSQLLRSIHRP